ncbi:RepA family replication protein, partial [Klebsiella pneumoniae]|uniref:RepA family replication protein n=1 Tax=Klebsiella pneumoniae TaxID=573 RepID=UPI002164E358
MTDHNQQSSCKYVQVNNPEPVFTVPQDYTPWPFSLKLMVKANGFTESFSFDIASAMSRRDGIRKRKPPFLRRRAMNALLMAMCFYYDPLSNKVLRSLREIALECGLATKSLSGEVSITRKRLVRTVLIFTESSDQLSRATDRVPGLPAS